MCRFICFDLKVKPDVISYLVAVIRHLAPMLRDNLKFTHAINLCKNKRILFLAKD